MTDAAIVLPTQPRNSTDPRTLIVSRGTFDGLRALQRAAPGPRIDLRYLLEGVLATIAQSPELSQPWLAEATDALRLTLARRLPGRHGDLQVAGIDTGPIHGAAAGEGAQARTPGAPPPSARDPQCKALHIGAPTYDWLKGIQASTTEPRLDFKFLVQGALTLLFQHQHLLTRVVHAAREALRLHLEQLASRPIQPFTLDLEDIPS